MARLKKVQPTPSEIADAIERGRARFPKLKVAREALVRYRGSSAGSGGSDAALIEYKNAETPDPAVTAVCAGGFAILGCLDKFPPRIHGATCPVRGCIGTMFSDITLPHLNDEHGWSPEKIVAFLRTLPS